MIDVENEIYTTVAKKLRETFPGVNISGSYINTPSSFPHVSLVESGNSLTGPYVGSLERATLTYEVNVYSDKQGGKKSECRRILAVIDQVMLRLNFTRTVMSPIPNLENSSIYRLLARYEAVADGQYLYNRR